MPDRELRQQERLEDALEALVTTRGVLGAVVATEDGFVLAARLAGDQDGEALAATAAAIGRSAGAALARLGRGKLQMAMLEASRFRLLVRAALEGYLLVVAEPEANVGLMLSEMEAAAAAVGKRLPA